MAALRAKVRDLERTLARNSKQHSNEVAALHKEIAALRRGPTSPASQAVSPSCPACDSSRVRVIDSWPMPRKRHAVGCDECGLLFVDPQPTEEALATHYAPDGAYRAKNPLPAPLASYPAHEPLLAALDQFFPASAPPPGSRMLDYGCGVGAFLNTFQNHGWETFGIEPSSDVAFVRHTRLETVPTDERFDFVMMHHVLEHLGRPLDALRNLAAAVKPGGHCLISVPRLDTIDLHGDVGYCLQSHTHIVAFTQACLTGLLARSGFGAVGALHGLDSALTKGRPTSLRLLSRKGAAAGITEDPVAALQRVVDLLPTVSAPASR